MRSVIPCGMICSAYAESLYSDAELETKRRQYAHAAGRLPKSRCYTGRSLSRFIRDSHRWCSGFWMPNRDWEGCDVDDPSARVLSNYGDSGC